LVIHGESIGEDWEEPDRVESILKLISSEFERTNLEFLSRVHSAEYLAFINDLSKELESRAKGTSNDKNRE